MHDPESSQATQVAQEKSVPMIWFLLGRIFSSPIAIVSASRPAAACGSPAAPSHFEGNSWMESKVQNTGQVCLEIDLIVAEDGEKVENFISSGQIPASSAFNSGESS
ncbi:hypothetical protein OIU77_026131 [Salix suchowensis]|uniref:Uncharacterized protein n=1 Tax=Salix suchowensis TaxID=1278906 RepID=A0ABQ9C0E3_9ROSI|nr:hypothetical protein OIU77_026131 [Salix suchowensis]